MKKRYGAELVTDIVNMSDYGKIDHFVFWDLMLGRVTAYLRPVIDEMSVLSADASESLHHGYYVIQDFVSGETILNVVFNDPKPNGKSVDGQGVFIAEFDCEIVNEQRLKELLLSYFVGRMFDDFPTLSYIKINRKIVPLIGSEWPDIFDLEDGIITVSHELAWILTISRGR
ncbi:hypothetical protein ACPV4B_06550 [Vibrio parahaemolyticus]